MRLLLVFQLLGLYFGDGRPTLAQAHPWTAVAWGAGTNRTDNAPNFGQAAVPADLGEVKAIAAGGYHSWP